MNKIPQVKHIDEEPDFNQADDAPMTYKRVIAKTACVVAVGLVTGCVTSPMGGVAVSAALTAAVIASECHGS